MTSATSFLSRFYWSKEKNIRSIDLIDLVESDSEFEAKWKVFFFLCSRSRQVAQSKKENELKLKLSVSFDLSFARHDELENELFDCLCVTRSKC